MDTLIQPFRRNLKVAPVVGPVGIDPVATAVPAMTGGGVTSFVVVNPNPFWMWFAGWTGAANAMPVIRERGHYIAPGEKYIGRTQMPNWVAAVADDEPMFPIYDAQGGWLYAGKRTRFVLIYGSGS